MLLVSSKSCVDRVQLDHSFCSGCVCVFASHLIAKLEIRRERRFYWMLQMLIGVGLTYQRHDFLDIEAYGLMDGSVALLF